MSAKELNINDSSSDIRYADAGSIQQFIHDARTPLSVIVTGLEALKAVRTDEQTFDEVLRMMKTEGADRFCKLLDQLSAMAPSAPPTDGVTDANSASSSPT